MRIRECRVDELPVLQDIERAAGLCFRDVGMPEITDDEPLTLDELAVYQQAGHAWVAADAGDRPIAYLIADLTLTTFTEVPWNALYYVRCGFRLLDDAELTPGLRGIRRQEAEHGLDRWPRACMRRDL